MKGAFIILIIFILLGCSNSKQEKLMSSTDSVNGTRVDTAYVTVHDTIYDTTLIKKAVDSDNWIEILTSDDVYEEDLSKRYAKALYGDTSSYYSYSYFLMTRSIPLSPLELSIYVGNNYKYAEAFLNCLEAVFETYEIEQQLYDRYRNLCDFDSKMLALYFMTQGSNMKEKICQMYMDEAKSGYFKQLYPSYPYTRSKIYLDNGCKNVKLAFKEIE